MATLTADQSNILDYLRRVGTAESPTEIGRVVGGVTRTGLVRHSSWACPKLKDLVRLGLVERTYRGWYRAV